MRLSKMCTIPCLELTYDFGGDIDYFPLYAFLGVVLGVQRYFKSDNSAVVRSLAYVFEFCPEPLEIFGFPKAADDNGKVTVTTSSRLFQYSNPVRLLCRSSVNTVLGDCGGMFLGFSPL